MDSSGAPRLAYRADERSPMGSTFKFLAATAILARVDAGKDASYARSHMARMTYWTMRRSPRCMSRKAGCPWPALCAAAIEMSINTAGNLLLQVLGGPAGGTAWCRSLGDATTRLDRIEPFVNEALPGDVRDTTAPSAMLGLMETLLLGDALKPASREQLQAYCAHRSMTTTCSGRSRPPRQACGRL